jgi:uncharacterized protein YjaZ
MNKDLSQIEFYFPQGNFDNKEKIVDSIISLMKEKGSTDYSGYADLDLLKQGLLDHIGKGEVSNYKTISDDKKKEIEDIIFRTIEKCNENLSVPTKNFVFVHPYFPTKEDEVFDGVMAVAVYSCVFHLFINLEQATEKSIENTVAHELNHTIYYYHHYDDFNNYTLLDEILLEGLAENFREQYFDSEITKWAGALDREEALQILKDLDIEILNSRDQKIIKKFLFGNQKYKKWTGYSTGYWLVKEFIKQNTDLSWNDLMKLERDKFLEIIK